MPRRRTPVLAVRVHPSPSRPHLERERSGSGIYVHARLVAGGLPRAVEMRPQNPKRR